MPVPTSYSESIFADYLASVLGEVGPIIGWDAGSVQVLEAVNDTLLEFGTTDISTVTKPNDLLGLRALGRRAVWRAVVQAVSGKYDFADSDAKFSRSQMQEMALESLKLAESDCVVFSPSYAVHVVKVTHPNDPYAILPDEERIP